MDRQEWDERYSGTELLWRAEPNQFLVAEVEMLAPGRGLDLACGEGRNAVWLAGLGWHMTGVDFSAVGLSKAESLAADRGVEIEWIEADVVDWSAPESSFDLVAIFYLQLPEPERRRVNAGAAAALAPGGTLLVVGHDSTNITEGYGGPQDPSVLFSPDDVVADLGGGLVIERAERVERRVSTDNGEATAIDCLVRAHRDQGGSRKP